MYKRILSLIIAGFTLLFACTQPEVDYYGSISGIVKDALTNDLLVGVKVTISPGGESQMTSIDGTFSFKDLESNEYTISFSKEGYNPDSQKVNVKPGSDASVQVVMTQIPETKGNIVGIVKDSQTGTLIEGVQVSASPGGASMITGIDGLFRFDKLEAQEYLVVFSKDGYEGASQQVNVKAGTDVSVQVVMTPIQPKLSVSAKALSFGNDTKTLSIDITNTGKGTLEWEINESVEWIECSPMSGKTTNQTSTVVVTVIKDKLDQGNYNDSFVISSNGGSETILVSTSVNGITLEVEPAELDFGTIVTSLGITLTNTATGSLAYEATATNSWISLSKTSGNITKTDNLTVIVSREGLSAGKYDGNINFNTKNGSVSIPVKMEVAVDEKPTVTVENVSDITFNSAVLQGTVVSPGSDKITRYGFCWSENQNPTLEDFYSNLGDCKEPRAFESAITNLKSETKYYFRAYAENNVGLTYSETTLSFSTDGLPMPPSVTTGAISNITSKSATAKGNITSMGNVGTILNYGHVWAKTPEPTISTGNRSELGKATETASFTSEISGLEVATTYYIRAYATNEKGTSYGDEVSFKTLTENPVVKTGEVTEIIHNAATCSGLISYTGGNYIIEKGICFSKNAMPTTNDSKQVATLEKGDSFSCRISGLEAETQYYIRAYVKTTGDITYYGEDKTFRTTKEVKLATLSTVSVSNIQPTSATFTSTITSNGNSEISECGFCWSDVAEPSVVDNHVNCDPQSYELGKNITNLKDGTKYYVRAFAKNAMGYSYSDLCIFETQRITKPEISDVTVDNIGKASAEVSATVASTGNSELLGVGFVWSVSPEPTIYDNIVECEISKQFSTKVTGLPQLTTIHLRAYATNGKGTAYSDDISITTTDSDIDIWDGESCATSFSGGTGTSDDPIIIASAAELVMLRKKVNSGSKYSGIYFALDTDIDLKNLEWTPIGLSSYPFSGNFNGRGHIIKNLRITGNKDDQGLFGYVSAGRIEGIRLTGSVKGNKNVAGLCGYIAKSVINCCDVDCSVNGVDNVGGIIGYLYDKGTPYSTLRNCINRGQVSGDDNVGGILGYCYSNEGSLRNILNVGIIEGKYSVAGIIGEIYSSEFKIYNAVNYALGNEIGIIGYNGNYQSLYCSGCFWLNDLVNGVGNETGFNGYWNTTSGIPNSYFSRNGTSCFTMPGNQDIVTLLNSWINNNDSSCKLWKYEIVDGYARPIFDIK